MHYSINRIVNLSETELGYAVSNIRWLKRKVLSVLITRRILRVMMVFRIWLMLTTFESGVTVGINLDFAGGLFLLIGNFIG